MLSCVKYSLMFKFIYAVRYVIHFMVVDPKKYYESCDIMKSPGGLKDFLAADSMLKYALTAEFI